MASPPAVLVNFGGTRVAVDLFDHFGPGPGGLLECHRCVALTQRPGEHLEWHISIGDNPLAPAPTGEQTND